MGKKKQAKQQRVAALQAAGQALRLAVMQLLGTVHGRQVQEQDAGDADQLTKPCEVPTEDLCKQAEREYDNARVQEVNYLFGGPMYMLQVLTECGHTVYFKVPSLGEADNYLPLCECGDIIPHPKDTTATLEFWAAKGALDIAIGTVTSTRRAALDASRHIRKTALRNYESAKRRQARYEVRKAPKTAKEDAVDRVVGELVDVMVKTTKPLHITGWRQQLTSAQAGTTEYLVFTDRGDYIVVFADGVPFPFTAGEKADTLRDETVEQFWQSHGAITAKEYPERPLTKTGVDELSVKQGTAVPSEVPEDDMVQRFADAIAAEEVVPYQVVTGSEAVAEPEAIQIYSHKKLGRPAINEVEYLVVTSLGDHIVVFHPNKAFPFAANQVVLTPDSESLPDFWKRYGAVSMRHKTDADK